MIRRLLACSLLLMVLLFSATVPDVARAEEPVVGSATVVKADSFMCRKLALNPDDTSEHGYLKMLTAPEGKAFLVVWNRLQLKFGKNEDGEDAVYIDDEHITLKDSKGALAHVVGTCTRDGRYSEGSGYISEYKEYLDGDEVDYNPVFVVPEGEQEFTLQIATTANKFTAPMKLADTIDRTGAAAFKIDSVQVYNDFSELRELRVQRPRRQRGQARNPLALDPLSGGEDHHQAEIRQR